MSLQVRYVAWLHSVPENPDSSGKHNDVSRLKAMEANGMEIVMPPFDGPHHVLEYFWEVGPTLSIGMGSGPLSHAEIMAWQSNIGIKLSPWECRTLKRLSYDYLAEIQRGSKRTAFPPWSPPDRRAERLHLAEQMRQSMRKIAQG